MKKVKCLSLILSILLLMQSVPVPAAAEAETTQTEPTETEQAITTQTEELPFGTVCIQKGCRTINGMVPLAGSEKKLETAQAVFLYETNSNTVVYAYNPDVKLHPGTLAKIVMALIVLENCGLDDLVTVTEGIQSYVPAGASKVQSVSLKSNEEIKVRDLLYALLLINANDAAVALAHHVSGTTAAFLELMNKRVKQMGCTNTEFGNVSGLYTAQSSSTARDMTRIVQEAIKNENFREIFGAKSYQIPDTNMVQGRKEFKTQNYMIDDSTLQDFYDSRVTGGFASYYESYGASIVCTAEYKNMNFIAVILGATRTFAENGWQPKIYGNFNEMSDLLDYAFNSFKINRIIYEGMALSTFKVNGGECNAVGQANVNVDTVVPINAQMKNIQMNYEAVDGGLTAPIKKDQMIATLEVVYRNSVLTEVEVYAMSDVRRADKTGVSIRSSAVEGSKGTPGFLSALGTICVIVLGVAIAYLAFNAYMRNRIRARRRKRRAQRRRNN
ncbi:MAG: serine hydrolase [Candidatus Faecousia sp.]|nr:serine hydrolase [Bacillota bacterium]MDY4598790.1 serine hydrolase [Candidatus Faecousia sp.]